jgi:Cupin-like domain
MGRREPFQGQDRPTAEPAWPGDMIPDSPEALAGLGKRYMKTRHRLHETGMFSEEALVKLIDSYPRHLLQAFTMGTDPEKMEELQPVDTAGVPGADILEAVKIGRLWFKLLRIYKWKGPYADVIRQVYDELQGKCPGFRPVDYSANLLFGSPGSQVYFHADGKPNMLWHVCGKKRFWLYPAGDTRLVSQESLEDIFENVQDEEVPYSTEFDRYAEQFDLEPGDLLSWPQNSPHRVCVTGGMSVSITTFYQTDESIRREHIYGANRLLRRTLKLHALSTRESGAVALAKETMYRACRRAGLLKEHPARKYVAECRIDPRGPGGVSRIAGGPVVTDFSKAELGIGAM